MGSSKTINGWIENIINYKNHFFFDLRSDTVTRVICKDKTKLQPGDYVVLKGDFEANDTNMFMLKEILYHSKAIRKPPFALKDNVNLAVERNKEDRFYWLRNHANKELFLQYSKLLTMTEDYFIKENFCRIITPKLISSLACESGAEVFKIEDTQYYNNFTLAQSPQLYKQMAINAGFKKVFELAPMYRAEKFKTTRHSYEAFCLDVELECYELSQLVKLITNYIQEIYEKLAMTKPIIKVVSYADVINVFNLNYGEKLTTEIEKESCKYFKANYLVISHYPPAQRPFYTKENLCFDLINENIGEIASGAIRETDCRILKSKEPNLEVNSSYFQSFMIGAPGSGGFGLGLDRLMMAINGKVSNIKDVKLFPY